MNLNATPPPYAPNVVNQTVSYGGVTWKGNPGSDWTPEQPSQGSQVSPNLNMGGQPTFDLVAATEAAYNTPEIKAANKAIADRQAALVTAQTEINDNPFYSEATRVGKSAKLTQQADMDIAVHQNLLTSLKADAAIKLGAQQGQYNINEQAYKDRLTNFNNVVAQGGLDGASDNDIANFAVQTGIPTSMIKSIQNLSRQKNTPDAEKPQIITSTDNSGNLSILAVDSTGKVINQTQVSGAGKAATYKGQLIGETGATGGGGAGATDPKKQIAADKAAAPSMLAQDVKQKKMTLGTAMGLYLQYGLTKQKIYDIYLANTSYKQTTATREADKARYGVK